MKCIELINILALIFNFIGFLILFKFGFPQPSFEGSVGIALEDNTPLGNGMTAKEHREYTTKKEITHKRYSYLGLILISLGFIIQMISSIIDIS